MATILIPVVSDARANAGDVETFNNRTSDSTQIVLTHMSELKENDLMVIRNYSGDQHTVTINGEEYVQETIGGNMNWLMSDGITINQNSAGTQYNIHMPGYLTTVINSASNSEITLTNGVVTVTNANGTITGTYTWAYYYDPDGEYIEVKGNNPRYTPYYLNSTNQLIASGLYSSGDNKGYYSVKEGSVEFSGEYAAGLSTSALSSLSGYTDVYKGVVTITVDDESFQPYIVLVPNSIIGHEASGGAYNLYGVIPLFVVVLILLSAVTIIRSKDA